MRLERGDIHGILGANGSGKSTLIRLICGLLTLDEGRVEVFGHDIVREEMAVKRLINRVSVDAAFFKKLSPMENLLFAARLYGLDGTTAKREAIAILARLGISEKRIDRPIEQMSRGMQQKVAIARALLTSPTLLLLDEPTTGLDPRSKLDVQSFIEELRETHDATIVLTTHDLAEAERLCGRITILNDGKVVAEDTPGRPQDPHPRSRGRTRDARRRVHDLHRPLPRRRRRGRRRRDRMKGGDNHDVPAQSCTAAGPGSGSSAELEIGRPAAPGRVSHPSPSARPSASRFIRIGARLAAEPSLESARSR